MTQYLIMCRSLTHAQKAARILERAGFTATIVKAPQKLTTGGCGYAVTIRSTIEEAIKLLKRFEIPIGKIFSRIDAGDYTEVTK